MKLYVYAALAFLIAGVWYYSLYIERQAWQTKMETAAAEHAKKETALVAEVAVAKSKRQIVYQDRIRIVKDAQSACLDTRIDPSILSSLRADTPDH